MRRQRLFLADAPADGGWTLPEKRAHYLRRVLRLKPGYQVTVFDGRGQQWQAALADATGQRLELLEDLGLTPQQGLGSLLIQCVGRGERMDYALQKATELGVREVMPVSSERTEVRLSGDRAQRRLEHWQAVVVQACEQCGRSWVPQVHALSALDEALTQVDAHYDVRLALTPEGQPLSRDQATPSGLAVLIGPEGGLSDAELRAAHRQGFTATALGPRVLRTETAGPAMLAAAQALWGDFAA